MKKVDYIIVGMGLAGCCLAVQLLRRGKKILVYDQPRRNRATAVAAGLFNPVTGKRVVRSWKADLIFPYLHEFYSGLEKEYGINFYHVTPVYTPFRSVGEQNDWIARTSDGSFEMYGLKILPPDTYADQVKDPLGGIEVERAGYISTSILLDAVRKDLIQRESYKEEVFDEAKIKSSDSTLLYDDTEAKKIVFCVGVHGLNSKYFGSLNLKPLKGEVLTVLLKEKLRKIFNRGAYLIQMTSVEYKVGSTYDLKRVSEGVTEAARKELETKLDDLLRIPFEVAHQDWGIRPATGDRRPLLGVSPLNENILIFNGLGTKGVSLAPYFSGQLADYLIGYGKLDQEANISRLKSLYSMFR
ncbi:MAG: FAD-dependent oxidoreductase [Cyclobacteriaceae bacterium]|nr:FAD-dependent oxidoreductase [Cyclobacteriaceae bacterium]